MTFITSDIRLLTHRHAVCLGTPLATCALPKGVCYLLTYVLKLSLLFVSKHQIFGFGIEKDRVSVCNIISVGLTYRDTKRQEL